MDTAQVTSMYSTFRDCFALTTVPTLDTARVTDMRYMLYGCWGLRDGNVTLTVKRRDANTEYMINNTILSREPFITIE